MTGYMIRLRYDGTCFCGYQIQDNGRTVGGELLTALNRTFGSVTALAGCSRTDSGVHALDYCVSFCAEKTLDPGTVVRALNSWLPQDVSVLRCEYTDTVFHARHDVKEKEYMYIIYNSPIRDPFAERYALRQTRQFDIDKLNAAASVLVGKHDFSSFSASGCKVSDRCRHVKHAYFVQNGTDVRFYIAADGFLYNMVRIIVGTLLDMSAGRINYSDMPHILQAKNRNLAGSTAPAHALFLNKVIY